MNPSNENIDPVRQDGPSAPESEDTSQEQDPGISSVYDYMLFSLSLPERALRSTSAMVGGALRESADLLVPQAFRSSKSYSIFVQQMLDFMAENVGGVDPGDEPDESSPTQVENYVARKTVGNFVDLAGLATFHISPITFLAIISDVAYGSQTYLQELSQELKKQGVIDDDTTIDRAADLLSAVSKTSSTTAEAFDMPPLSVDGLKNTIDQTTQAAMTINAGQIMPQAELARMWNDIHDIAKKENVGLMEVSSAMTMFTLNRIGAVGTGALSTVKVAGNLFDQHILDHYSDGIADIRQKGLYVSLAESSKPYIDAVWNNFSTEKTTLTEDLLSGKMIGRAFRGMGSWFRRDKTAEESDESSEN